MDHEAFYRYAVLFRFSIFEFHTTTIRRHLNNIQVYRHINGTITFTKHDIYQIMKIIIGEMYVFCSYLNIDLSHAVAFESHHEYTGPFYKCSFNQILHFKCVREIKQIKRGLIYLINLFAEFKKDEAIKLRFI